MPFQARDCILHEANYRQLLNLNPNVAVLPWGATEAHNFHLPYGTDVIEATALGEQGVLRANKAGARCVLLPCVPFGIDHSQTTQVATITMRASTQALVLRDVAESLVRQGIHRLVLLNFHGGNDFRSMIRDLMFDLPIFIVQAHGFLLAEYRGSIIEKPGDHADEFETSLIMHLAPDWVAPLETAGPGDATPSALPTLSGNKGVWFTRDWPSLTADTGVGDPSQSTAAKGKQVLELLSEALAAILLELSQAKDGQFPLIVPPGTPGTPDNNP